MTESALIATFDASSFPSGRLTGQHAGMAVRLSVADDILEDGLDATYEVVGGPREVREQVMAGLRAEYGADIKITQNREDVLRFIACFHNWQILRDHPVMSLLIDKRYAVDRMSIVYEAGQCVLRLTFPAGETDASLETHRANLAQVCKDAGLVALVRVGALDREMEDWKPFDPSATF